MKRNEQGRSMVEMLGVLAIIGVLSAGALAGYSRAMAKHRLNKTTEQMVSIINNVRTNFYKAQNTDRPYAIFGADEDSTKAGMIQAMSLSIFPEEMITNRAQGEVRNLYKGKVYIITADEGETFEVIFEDLPQEVSVALGTINWGTDDVSGLQGLDIEQESQTN